MQKTLGLRSLRLGSSRCNPLEFFYSTFDQGRPTMKNQRLTYVFMLTSLLMSVTGITAAEPPAELQGKALLEVLRDGGYNLYFRHAATDWSQQDQVHAAGDWESCDPARMRQLSQEGRAAARAVGQAIRALDIPVGKVLSSPYCRTVETARLMNLGDVETTTDVMNMRVAAYFGGRSAIVARAQVRLSMLPGAGSNTVIVAHGNVAQAATPIYPQEGEGIVFYPDAAGGFRFIGRLTAGDWARLATEATH